MRAAATAPQSTALPGATTVFPRYGVISSKQRCPTNVMSYAFMRGSSWQCNEGSPLDCAGRGPERNAALENEEHDQGHRHGNDEGRAQCRHPYAVLPPHHGDAKREGP